MARVHIKSIAPQYAFFFCPGCESPHMVSIPPKPGSWGYNGCMERPTFTPSVLVTYNGRDADQPPESGERKQYSRCHSFVTDGRIEFLHDCTHPLAGQTVDLPEYPEKWK